MAKRKKLPFYEISAVTGQGVDALRYGIADAIRASRASEQAALPEQPAARAL